MLVMDICNPQPGTPSCVLLISSEGAISTLLVVSLQTALQKASRLSWQIWMHLFIAGRGPAEVCVGRHTDRWLPLLSPSDRTFVQKRQEGSQQLMYPRLPLKRPHFVIFFVPCGQTQLSSKHRADSSTASGLSSPTFWSPLHPGQ